MCEVVLRGFGYEPVARAVTRTTSLIVVVAPVFACVPRRLGAVQGLA